nr:hypothetical protein C07D8.4 - Caenorhabditis elegans [Caenorhabditis elegans]
MTKRFMDDSLPLHFTAQSGSPGGEEILITFGETPLGAAEAI